MSGSTLAAVMALFALTAAPPVEARSTPSAAEAALVESLNKGVLPTNFMNMKLLKKHYKCPANGPLRKHTKDLAGLQSHRDRLRRGLQPAAGWVSFKPDPTKKREVLTIPKGADIGDSCKSKYRTRGFEGALVFKRPGGTGRLEFLLIELQQGWFIGSLRVPQY